MNLTRVARTASAAIVAGVAAVASYSHMRQLAAEHGQSPLLANLLPVSVDGMLIVASAVLADDRAAGRPGRLSARVSFTIGVVASIIANVLAAPDNIVARFISAWPALALLLVVEMLTGGGPAATPAVAGTQTSKGADVPASDDQSADVTPRSSASRASGSTGTVARKPARGTGTVAKKPAGSAGQPSAADRVRAARAANPTATIADIARHAGVSDRTARRHLNGTPVG
ncbi:Protein of unknown function [Micromonospora rhizosphaerae]|uniref:DUF2637 domain-containing protein n=1 Tax=Micromonospora rhizosphaerae TaxID=568872 RepID=A0A1C6S2B6_9ACTN|nr:DUF2637 domain-containing protein [Micromonospora rhizosphaerae]SCL23403.1 Protein of unknown function [Micromonospora rhizosphaerae]